MDLQETSQQGPGCVCLRTFSLIIDLVTCYVESKFRKKQKHMDFDGQSSEQTKSKMFHCFISYLE